MAKPFIKWAGGKTKLVPEILKRLPFKWNDYVEPFVGGGAVFFAIRTYAKENRTPWIPIQAHLGDINAELINAYRVVQQTAASLARLLATFRHSQKFYYDMRESQPRTPLARAARFIYLNKTCFNGLYRVNKDGKFNVPVGKRSGGKQLLPYIIDREVFLEAHEALQGTVMHDDAFHNTIALAMKNDFIYCDPPYLPKTETAEFTAYSKEGFSLSDHEQLHASLKEADKRGAKWMLSEGDSKIIRKLFKDFNVMPVTSRHSVSAAAESRIESKELLITNYEKFRPWPVVG